MQSLRKKKSKNYIVYTRSISSKSLVQCNVPYLKTNFVGDDDINYSEWFLIRIFNTLLVELVLCAILISLEIETYNLIHPFLFVPEWPHWSLNYKGSHFTTKKTCKVIFCKKCWRWSFKFQTYFSQSVKLWLFVCILNISHQVLTYLSLRFLVFKIYSITPLLRAKLWKVVMKCNNAMFCNFRVLLLRA